MCVTISKPYRIPNTWVIRNNKPWYRDIPFKIFIQTYHSHIIYVWYSISHIHILFMYDTAFPTQFSLIKIPRTKPLLNVFVFISWLPKIYWSIHRVKMSVINFLTDIRLTRGTCLLNSLFRPVTVVSL